MVKCNSLLNGIVVETTVQSYTGNILYSDFSEIPGSDNSKNKNSLLNKCAKIPFVGIAAGIVRMALGIIHTLGHLFAALVTCKKGHLYHAAKGLCEILRGSIEAIPVAGRIFANLYTPAQIQYLYQPGWEEGRRTWWMIKMYNPEKPDGLDAYMHNWANFPRDMYVRV